MKSLHPPAFQIATKGKNRVPHLHHSTMAPTISKLHGETGHNEGEKIQVAKLELDKKELKWAMLGHPSS